jgi:predicted nucleic acid-binding protein
MKGYWDSSALVVACQDGSVRDRLDREGGVTRVHTFAEVFSTLTGGRLGFRVDPADAATLIGEIRTALEVVELDIDEVQMALGDARSKGVRGGRVHDYLHAVAAMKAGCGKVWTLNVSDFAGLFDGLDIFEP